MTNEEILKKALDKAESNGYVYFLPHYCETLEEWMDWKDNATFTFWDYKLWSGLIFNYDFAKAFFGTKCPSKECPSGDDDRPHDWAWQYHLQQMVLEEDPIKYLEKFV